MYAGRDCLRKRRQAPGLVGVDSVAVLEDTAPDTGRRRNARRTGSDGPAAGMTEMADGCDDIADGDRPFCL